MKVNNILIRVTWLIPTFQRLCFNARQRGPPAEKGKNLLRMGLFAVRKEDWGGRPVRLVVEEVIGMWIIVCIAEDCKVDRCFAEE
ncbi:MAG: hypothetical protein ABIG61_14280 [Planctomycetota bacterium]